MYGSTPTVLLREDRLRVDRRAFSLTLAVASVRLKHPALDVVGELQVKGGLQTIADPRVQHRHEHLDAAVEIPGHQVGRTHKDDGLTVMREPIGTGVFEEPAHDARHGDVLAHALDAGAQAADPADLERDLDAGAGPFVGGYLLQL